MKVTREVILDLLPLYLADEASKETQVLVKEYLDQDPDLAKLARQWRERLPEPPPTPVQTDAQTLAYLEAKRQMAIKTALLTGVFTVSIIALISIVVFMFFFSMP